MHMMAEKAAENESHKEEEEVLYLHSSRSPLFLDRESNSAGFPIGLIAPPRGFASSEPLSVPLLAPTLCLKPEPTLFVPPGDQTRTPRSTPRYVY